MLWSLFWLDKEIHLYVAIVWTMLVVKFIMEDFSSFEDKVCQHYKYLRENVEVFVSFNIVDQCLSTLKEKITWKDNSLPQG